MKLYTVHTAATIEQMKECIEKTGQAAMINEIPGGYAVTIPDQYVHVWTAGRWIAAIAVLSASPFVFRFLQIGGGGVNLSPLQGFGIGWITAAIVLLLGRNSMRPIQ